MNDLIAVNDLDRPTFTSLTNPTLSLMAQPKQLTFEDREEVKSTGGWS
jgi:hypothetical protein